MPAKDCFENACELLETYATLTYVEGLATIGGTVVAHAWCTDQQGQIVDPTWAGIPGDISQRCYVGIPYRMMFLYRHGNETGRYGALSNSPLLDFRDLRCGYSFDDDGCANGWATP